MFATAPPTTSRRFLETVFAALLRDFPSPHLIIQSSQFRSFCYTPPGLRLADPAKLSSGENLLYDPGRCSTEEKEAFQSRSPCTKIRIHSIFSFPYPLNVTIPIVSHVLVE